MAKEDSIRIGILDLRMGNLGNVYRALLHIGYKPSWVKEPKELRSLELLVFPGVGAFPEARKRLFAQRLWEPTQEWLKAGKPYIGICLGYQLLFEYGEEWGGALGLGFFSGRVTRLPDHNGQEPLKIPQIGWNELIPFGNPRLNWLKGQYAYFVHSFAPPEEFPCEGGTLTHYGRTFVSFAVKGKVAGVQFHPERSGPLGLRFLEDLIQELLNA